MAAVQTQRSAGSAAPLLPGSIESYLVRNVPWCGPDDTASSVRASLSERRYDFAGSVAVCVPARKQTRCLVGLVPVEVLLAAADESLMSDLMDPDPPVVVGPGTDQEEAAWKATRHGEAAVAVVDADEAFLGLVPPAKLLGVLLSEHDEDLARLGGYLSSTAAARHAMDEPLGSRLWHRLPWLVVGLFGAAVAAWLVRGFEGSLMNDVRLAFFIPGIVYMADAVGTQTETVVIRGLSVGVPVRRAFLAEAVTGLGVGATLAVVTVPLCWWALGSLAVAGVLGLSLMAACGVATVIAMALPWAIARLGRDPAFGSGPLATVVQDLLSLVIYFAIATALIG